MGKSKNFTEREKELLVSLVEQRKHIIENKKTDATTTAEKNNAWKEIESMFSAISSEGARTAEQLHTCYDNIKKRARKNLADDNVGKSLTGGGSYKPKVSEVEDRVISMVKEQFVPNENPYDNDALFRMETQTKTDENAKVDEFPAVYAFDIIPAPGD